MGKRKGTEAPEIAQWLTRFEKRFGASESRQSMQQLSKARELFFDELGYDLTRKQFEALRSEANERTQEEILDNVRVETGRKYISKKDGKEYYQTNYRDTRTGRFTKRQ